MVYIFCIVRVDHRSVELSPFTELQSYDKSPLSTLPSAPESSTLQIGLVEWLLGVHCGETGRSMCSYENPLLSGPTATIRGHV